MGADEAFLDDVLGIALIAHQPVRQSEGRPCVDVDERTKRVFVPLTRARQDEGGFAGVHLVGLDGSGAKPVRAQKSRQRGLEYRGALPAVGRVPSTNTRRILQANLKVGLYEQDYRWVAS